MSNAITAEEIKGKTDDELFKINQKLMWEKEMIVAEQDLIKAELNARHALKGFNSLPDAEKQAIIQHINAGNLAPGARS